jgi:hypothetical protein
VTNPPTRLATRLRRELAGYEADLAGAAARLEAARQEERDAGLALLGRQLETTGGQALEAAEKRLGFATRGRELAWLAFGIARARVNLHAGVLRRLEPQPTEG